MASHTTLKAPQLLAAIGFVALGGAVGTAARDLSLKVDTTTWYQSVFGSHGWSSHVPWALMFINLVGVLLATLALRGPLAHHDPNDPMRVFAITGFFGGLTSFSSLYVSLGAIWHLSVIGAIATTVCCVLAGVSVAWLGALKRPPHR